MKRIAGIVLEHIRHYPVTCALLLVVWWLSFFTVPETKLEDVPFIDKWTHIAMYGGTCAVLWIEYLRRHTTLAVRRLLLWAWLAPVLMSGVIEILQENCTGGRRSGDYADFAANVIGVTLAAVFGLILSRFYRGSWR